MREKNTGKMKMDLIDRNRLYLKARYINSSSTDLMTGMSTTYGNMVSLNDIMLEPTVEAIPIKWIKDYMNTWAPYSEMFPAVIKCLINAWEKENEK